VVPELGDTPKPQIVLRDLQALAGVRH
jgi:hypothetical protein